MTIAPSTVEFLALAIDVFALSVIIFLVIGVIGNRKRRAKSAEPGGTTTPEPLMKIAERADDTSDYLKWIERGNNMVPAPSGVPPPAGFKREAYCEHAWDGPRVTINELVSIGSCSKCGAPVLPQDEIERLKAIVSK